MLKNKEKIYKNIKKYTIDYENDGVVLISGLFSNPPFKNFLSRSIDYARKYPSPFSDKVVNSKNDIFFHDFYTYKRNKNICDIIFNKDLLEFLSIVTKNRKIQFFHDHILIKSSSSYHTPWHHDRPYYFLDGKNNFTLWISDDDIEEDNSIAFIRKSHMSKNIYNPVNFKNGCIIGKHKSFKNLNNKYLDLESQNGILIYRIRKGDAILFNYHTLHRSLRTSEVKERKSLSLRFVGEKAKITTKTVNPTPPFHLMGMDYSENLSLDEKWFPILFQK